MNEQKILNLLGMAQRAGRVASGDFAVTKAVQGRKARLLLVAADASEDTRKRYRQMAADASIELFYLGDRELLGHCIGKDFRAAVAVLDAGFANAIAKHCRSDSDTGVD
ncbi:L7Ae/L30e/S12e/Gadd45 family ribosomal protein [Anaerovibrio sp.]|uniref:L7Ae/L30e/S12e/Gadd45 family ribosomal protein n=1 Tax=Anaerovibrio sp. TaxID=1872532 RepID=UPI003F181868